MFLGITDKVGKTAFDSTTKSGEIIEDIIKKLPCECFKMNFVSFPPLKENGKLRYPTREELEDSVSSFKTSIEELQPNLIVVCGKMIFNFLKKKQLYQDKTIMIYHPSYIWVYQRKNLECYKNDVVKQIVKMLDCEPIVP